MNKQARLDQIATDIERCARCKLHTVGMAVPGEGSANAKVMFIGEAPGKNESQTGRPFIGRSGKLLRKLIAEAGLTDDQIYITSPVKRLPEYVTPKKDDIAHGRTHLNEQIDIINPRYLVLLGSVAVQAVLEEKMPVSTMHGHIVSKNNRNYFVTVHPAAALRFTKMKNILLEDFIALKQLISKK